MTSPKIIIYASDVNGNITNIFNEFFYDDVVICPFCMHVGALFHKIQWMDFTGHEMLWCPNCCAKSIILRETAQIITNEHLVKMLPPNKINEMTYEYDVLSNNNPLKSQGMRHVFYMFDIAKILRLSNHQCHSYKITQLTDFTPTLDKMFINGISRIISGYMQFSPYDTHNFIINNNLCNISENADVFKQKQNATMDTFNIVCGNAVESFDFYKDQHSISVTPYFWDMSLLVDSYDINNPIAPYPACVIHHDDLSDVVYLLCTDSNGDIFTAVYNESD
jgi:hypothetical protein